MKKNKYLTLDEIEDWRVYYHRRALDGYRDGLEMSEAWAKLDFAKFLGQIYKFIELEERFAQLDAQRQQYLIHGTENEAQEKNSQRRRKR